MPDTRPSTRSREPRAATQINAADFVSHLLNLHVEDLALVLDGTPGIIPR
jgi:hypothetical protein